MKRKAVEARRQSYSQPQDASWREFIKGRAWTPRDIDELPDDWLQAEWGMYILRIRYGIE